jgi:hypothetical protein
MQTSLQRDIWNRDSAYTPPKRLHLGILAGLTVLYAVLITVEVNRCLSFDELITYHIAKAPTVIELFHLLKKWDLNPPFLHLLAHYSMQLFGDTAFGVRFPSVLEFYIASIVLFAYTRKKLGDAYSCIPVLVLWCSPTFQYATEARPYALLCMCFCCLLLCWDMARSFRHRRAALWGIALANLGLIGSHVFAPLSLFPFLVAELIRWRQRRIPDYPVWAALLLPMAGMFGYVPLYTSYKTIAFYPPAFQASFHQIAAFYGHLLKVVIPCLLCTLLGARVVKKHPFNTQPLRNLGMPEFVIFAILAVNPILLNFVLMQDHSAFWPRYAITSIVSAYLCFALLLAWLFSSRPEPGYAASLAVAALLIGKQIGVPFYQNLTRPRQDRTAMALAAAKPNLPIVAASGLTFVELGHYGNPAVLHRLVYLRDRQAAIRYANATMFEDLDRMQPDFSLPGRVNTYPDFIARHRHFLVLGTPGYPEDWLLKRLADEHAAIQLVGEYELPYKDRALYEVSMR